MYYFIIYKLNVQFLIIFTTKQELYLSEMHLIMVFAVFNNLNLYENNL